MFKTHSKNSYSCMDGDHPIEYEVKKDPFDRYNVWFQSDYPQFGCDKINHPDYTKMKIETYEAEIGPIAIITGFKFELASKQEITHEELKEEIEKLLPLIIGDCQCVPAAGEHYEFFSESEFDTSDKNWW